MDARQRWRRALAGRHQGQFRSSSRRETSASGEPGPGEPCAGFAGDPAETELLEESDFNLEKARTDMLVAGHVHAPEGRPTEEAIARVKLAGIDKSLRVTGERAIVEGPVSIRATRPRPFAKLPISWHRSYGGTDPQASRPEWEPRNPVGAGFAVDPRSLVGRLAPNFAYPEADSRRPAGFGPIARHWMPRVGYAGTYDEDWKKNRDPLPPRDFDRRFYQCAPEDQQTGKPLTGYEHVRLGNLTPDGFLQFLLPRVAFDIVTQFYRRPDRRQEATIHALLLRPDERRFCIVWHSALPCPYDEERLKSTTIRVRRRINVPASVARTGVWSL